MRERYADIIVDISHEKVDRPFQYIIPQELVDAIYPGVRVHVPFGRGNQDKTGYVVDLSEETDYPVEKLKEITSVDEKGISAEGRQIQIAYWLKQQYGSTMITALKTVLPVKQQMKRPEKKKIVRCVDKERLQDAIEQCRRKHQVAKVRVLTALITEEELPYELVRQKLNVAPATLQALEKQGYLVMQRESYYRNPVRQMSREEERPCLTEMQAHIIALQKYCQIHNHLQSLSSLLDSHSAQLLQFLCAPSDTCPQVHLPYAVHLTHCRHFHTSKAYFLSDTH